MSSKSCSLSSQIGGKTRIYTTMMTNGKDFTISPHLHLCKRRFHILWLIKEGTDPMSRSNIQTQVNHSYLRQTTSKKGLLIFPAPLVSI